MKSSKNKFENYKGVFHVGNTLKRTLALLLTTVLVFGIMPSNLFASAAESQPAARYGDTAGHWASPAIEQWSDYGIVNGYGGNFRPSDPITRAEMAALMQRVIGYTEIGENPFADVEYGKWYYDDVLKLAAAGIMAGYDGKARPEDNITREEAAALIARAFGIPALDTDPNPFNDAASLSDWAKGIVNALHAAGYISGMPGNIFNPKADITRAEAVTIIDNFIKAFYNAPGEYSGNVNGNVVIRSDGVTLKDMTISGDLYITAGAENGTVTLDNVTVLGKIINLGGANIVNKEGDNTPTPGDTGSGSGNNSGTGGGGGNNSGTGGGGNNSGTGGGGGNNNGTGGGGGNNNGNTGNNVTVSFQTNGGSEAPPVTLKRGERLSSLPMPSKEDYAFTGWYTDSGLADPFYSDVPVERNMTLYADYAERDNNLQEQVNPSLYLADRNPNFAVTVVSPVALTSANLADYIDLVCNAPGGFPALNVTGSAGKYTITPATPYEEGWLYTMTLKSESLSFDGGSDYNGQGVRELSFRIHKDEVAHVEFAEGVVPVLRGDVTEDLGGGAYTIPADKYSRVQTMFDAYDTYNKAGPYYDTDPDTGDTVELPDKSVVICMISGAPAGFDISGDFDAFVAGGALDGLQVEYLKVMGLELIFSEDGQTLVSLLLYTNAECMPGDIYKDLDLWQENMATPELMWAAMKDLDTDKIAQDVANSKGAAQLSRLLSMAIDQSPTVQALLAEADNGDSAQPTTLNLNAAQLLAATSDDEPSGGRIARPEHPGADLLDWNGRYEPECFFEPGMSDHGLSVKAGGFVKDLKVTVEVRGTDNANFPSVFPAYYGLPEQEWKTKYKGTEYENDWPNVWPMMVLKFEYETTLKGKVKIAVEVEIREYLTMSVQGGAVYNGKFFYPSTWDDLYFDIAANFYSQTDLYLEVLVTSADDDDDDDDGGKDDGKGDDEDSDDGFSLDITAEIGELMSGGGRDPSAILEKVLGEKGSPIDIVKVDLFNTTFTLIPGVPVADVTLELDFVVRVNFAAGIASRFTYLCAQQVGVTGDLDKKVFSTYKHALENDGLYEFDFYAAGYFGIEAGLQGKIGIGLYGLTWLAKVGAAVEVGAYLDIYGFVHITIGKYYNDVRYIYSDYYKFWHYVGTEPMRAKLSIQGGIYMETGIYVRISVFAESEIFNVKKEAVLYQPKIPLFSLGEKYVLSKFKNSNDAVRMSGERMPLLGTGGLVEAEYINITTGKKETGSFAALDRFDFQFSNPAFSRQGNDIVIDKTKIGNAMRMDTTIMVYYKGGSLTFGNPTWYIEKGVSDATYNNGNIDKTRAKLIWLTWLDASIPAFADLTTPVKATYVLNLNGAETVLSEKEVLPGNKPGAPVAGTASSSWDQWLETNRKIKITSYDDFNRPITANTVYKIYAQKAQSLAGFLTLKDGQWQFDVYAVNAGDVPTPPAGYNAIAGVPFTGWKGSSIYGEKVFELKPARALLNAADYSYMYTGLDTTKPLDGYSVSGDAALSAYNSLRWDNGYPLYNVLDYYYEAQYNRPVCKVTLNYQPVYIRDFWYPTRTPVVLDIQFGNGMGNIRQWTDSSSYFYDFAGIDSDGDGIADWDPDRSIIGDMEFTLLYKAKTNEVTVLDENGAFHERLTVNYGCDPTRQTTLTLTPPDNTLEFDCWEVSKNGGAAERFNGYDWDTRFGFLAPRDPDIESATFTIKPVYKPKTRYNVYFWIYYSGGASYIRLDSLLPGTYNVSDFPELVSPSPAQYKASDERYDYPFTGWECGDPFTVSADAALNGTNNIYFQPVFTPTAVVYTINFSTDYGELSTGGQSYSTTSTYDDFMSVMDAYKEANSPLATVYTTDRTYTFLEWDISIYYNTHTVICKATWSEAERWYATTFDAGVGATIASSGEQTSLVSSHYNDQITLPAAASVTKPGDNYTAHTLTGWKDSSGTEYAPGASYTVTSDMTFTAVYTTAPRVYTVTISAGGGKFADGTTANKVYTGGYGDATGISLSNPTKDATAQYTYTFSGWSSPIPSTFTEDITITAGFTQSDRLYTITFNANDGTFPGGGTIYTKDYTYGAAIDPTADGIPVPVKASAGIYSYEFTGWSPFLTSVTDEMEYTAQFLRVKTDTLPTGITISNGTTTEDITAGTISGYTYALTETYPDSNEFVPTLTVTGNGLTISGSPALVITGIDDTVRIVIEGSVTDVCFDDLSLYGAFHGVLLGEFGVSVVEFRNGSGQLTLTIEGDCVFEKDNNYGYPMKGDRDVLITGKDANASLTLTGYGEAFYFTKDVTVKDVRVNVSGIGRNEMYGNLTIMGDAVVEIVSSMYYDYALYIVGGALIFDDFTGTFNVRNDDPDNPHEAVHVIVQGPGNGILFKEGGLEVPADDYGVRVVIVPGATGVYDYALLEDAATGDRQDITVELAP